MSTISSSMSSMGAYGGYGNYGGGRAQHMEGRGKPDFSKIDTDGSGGLDQTELKAMLEKGPQSANGVNASDMFSKLDTDGDGSVTESELKSGLKPPSNDDQVQQGGWGAMGMDTQSFASMMGGGMSGMGPMQGPPPPPPNDDQSSSISDAINSLDSDGNGSVSSSEFGISSSDTNSTQKALFDSIDTDKDGSLSTKETNAFQDQIKALLEKIQQMGTQQVSSTNQSSSLSVSA
ncbi:MAG: EF-hand domain-containing protein [Burkholderiales bacterium]|nr:EF-hand domain-containing protein [Burkholderiales bacterium]